MDAWNNITFLATNGIGVGFRCRYQLTTYMNFRINGAIVEVAHPDNAELDVSRLSEKDRISVLSAYSDYLRNQELEYQEWRRKNAALFA